MRKLIDDYGHSIPQPPITHSMDEQSTKAEMITMSKQDLEDLVRATVEQTMGKPVSKTKKLQDDTTELDVDYDRDEVTAYLKSTRKESINDYDRRKAEWKSRKMEENRQRKQNESERLESIGIKQSKPKTVTYKAVEPKTNDLDLRIEEIKRERMEMETDKLRKKQVIEYDKLEKEEKRKAELANAEKLRKQNEHKTKCLTESEKLDSDKIRREQLRTERQNNKDKQIVEKEMNKIKQKTKKDVRYVMNGTVVDRLMKKKWFIPAVLGILFVGILIWYGISG